MSILLKLSFKNGLLLRNILSNVDSILNLKLNPQLLKS